MIESTFKGSYLTYGRTNGLRALQLLIEALKDREAIKVAKEAYNELVSELAREDKKPFMNRIGKI